MSMRSRAGAMKRRRAGYLAERLEPRQLLSTVTWTGAAGDGNWSTPGNWSGGAVPAAGDDAVIPTGFLKITISTGAQSVDSLSSDSPLAMTGGELDVGSGGATFSANLTLAGGTVRGGTLTFTGGAEVAVGRGNNVLDGVTLQGNLDLSEGAGGYLAAGYLTIRDGLTINGTILLGNADGTSSGDLTFAGTTPQTVATPSNGSATILFGRSTQNSIHNSSFVPGPFGNVAQAVTFAPGVLIHGQNGTINSFLDGSFINQGTIAVDVDGGWIQIANSFENQGTISATNGGKLDISELQGNLGSAILGSGSTMDLGGMYANYVVNQGLAVPSGSSLVLGGSWANAAGSVISATDANVGLGTAFGRWSNSGQIILTDSTTSLGGTVTTAGLGHLVRSGGTFNLGGILDNTGSILALNAATGSWDMAFCTIKGGAITEADGAELVATTFGGGLDGVTLYGDLDMTQPNGAYVGITDGLTLDGTIDLGSQTGPNHAMLNFGGPDQTFAATPGGTASVVFGAYDGQLSLNAFQSNQPEVLTLGPRVSISGGKGLITGKPSDYGAAEQIINEGTISATVAEDTITVQASLINLGILSARNGGTLGVQQLTGNLGGAEIDPGSSLLLGGTGYIVDRSVSVPSGATLSLAGSWTNPAGSTITATHATLDLGGTSGAWSNMGDVIVTNSVTNLGGAFTTADLRDFSRSGGTVNLTGSLDNSNSTLSLNDITGPWTLIGGTISKGAVTESGSLLSIIGGTLDGVTVVGSIGFVPNVSSSRYLFIKDGLRLNGVLSLDDSTGLGPPVVYFTGTPGQSLSTTPGGSARIVVGSNASIAVGPFNSQPTSPVAGLLINPGVQIEGGSGFIGMYSNSFLLLNRGNIVADGSGAVFRIYPPLTNQGTLEARNGATLRLDSVTNIASGNLTGGAWHVGSGSQIQLPSNIAAIGGSITLDGPGAAIVSGTVDALKNLQQIIPGGSLSVAAQSLGVTPAGGSLVSDGTIRISATAALEVGGAFVQNADGTLVDRLGGPPSGGSGQIVAAGPITLGGTLEVDWPAGLEAAPGTTLPVVAGSSRIGTFSAFVTSPVSMAGAVRVQYTANSEYLSEGGFPRDVIPGTAGNDTITLTADPEGKDIDWLVGSVSGYLPIDDRKGLTINGNGGSDVLTLDDSNGNPLPARLHLDGTFTINGPQSLNGTVLDIGRSTVYLNYAGASDPLSWVQTALRAGFDGGKWDGVATPTSGVIITSAGSRDYGIGYADSADGTGVNAVANTIELKYTLFGDANLDGRVNLADLLTVFRNLGKPGAWDTGDFNYDQTVNLFDLLLLARDYGKCSWTTATVPVGARRR